MYVQHTAGSGGWPLNVFLTPSLIPFFGGTYFGPIDEPGRPSFGSLLTLICTRWTGEAADLERSNKKIIDQLRKITDVVAGTTDSKGDVTRVKSIQKAFLYFSQNFDRESGGFGNGTKFPMPGTIEMLLNYYSLWNEMSKSKSN